MLTQDFGEQSLPQVKFMNVYFHQHASNIFCNNQYRGGTTWLDDNNVTWPTKCESGYGGNLCHACVRHNGVMYTRSNKHECLKCSPNQTLNILRLVGIGLCLILALSILIL